MRDVSVMIKTLETQGNWTFVFMGCGDDVFTIAKNLGVKYGNTSLIVTETAGDYRNTVTSGKLGGYKKFSDARAGGQTQITNFTGK
jgi:hypothetical protein